VLLVDHHAVIGLLHSAQQNGTSQWTTRNVPPLLKDKNPAERSTQEWLDQAAENCAKTRVMIG
jgi:hypothetical protein